MAEPVTFIEVIEAGVKYPGLYTPTGSFFEIISFLEGYGIGGNIAQLGAHLVFTPFREWLPKRLGLSQKIITWSDFRSLFTSDENALEQFLELFREFTNLGGKL